MISDLRKPQVLKRIGELMSIGMKPEEIRRSILEEFKINVSTQTVAHVIKTYSVKKKELIDQDDKFREMYKEIILDLVAKLRTSLNIIDTQNAVMRQRFSEAQGLDQSKEVKLLERHAEELKNTKDWGVVSNKIQNILKIIKAPVFRDNYRLITYAKEVRSDIRTSNDTIKTLNEILKRLEMETHETKVSTLKTVQLSISSLKELEKLGMIEIKPDYYREIKPEESDED